MGETILEFAPFNESITVKKFRLADLTGGRANYKKCSVLPEAKKVLKVVPPGERKWEEQLSITQAGDLFLEFGSYEYLNVPSFNIVQGVVNNEVIPETHIFIIDLISGQNLARKKFGSREANKARDQIEGFLISLTDYSSDKYLKGGFYVSDQSYGQYVYGQGPGDGERKVYFVDLYPYFGYLGEDDSWSRRFYAVDMLGFIGGFTNYMERRLGVRALIGARRRHQEFADIVFEGNPDLYNLRNKKFPYWECKLETTFNLPATL